MNTEIISFVESLKSDEKVLEFDEASTKQAIVLRLLNLLGWNTFNIDEVTPEYSVKGQRADYSLRINKNNKAFIEVKRIREDLEDHQEQLLNYSFQEGVKLSILTNGISWWFYLPLNERSWEQRKFYSIEILEQNSDDIASKFIDYLAKNNIASGQAIKNAEAIYKSRQKMNIVRASLPKVWNKMISEPDELLVELLIENSEKMCGFRANEELIEKFIKDNLENCLIQEVSILKAPKSRSTPKRTPLTKKTKPKLSGNYTGKTITSFTFKGTTYEVRSFLDMIRKLCNIMASLHKKDFDNVLKLVGRKRPYFTLNKNELRNYYKIEKTNIYVETNLSANQIVSILLELLDLFNYSNDDLRIEAY